jgi:alkylation response protein AidB-like acyl-CoA dehydrogenase
VADLVAVLDAADSRQATLFGNADSGPQCVAAAVTHPERVSGLVLCGTYAKGSRSADYPLGWTDTETAEFREHVRNRWGSTANLDENDDPAFRDWQAALMRLGASPRAVLLLQEMTAATDVRPLLARIACPTVVMHRTGDPVNTVEHGRFLAERIPGAHWVELPGREFLLWSGDTDSIADEVEEFLTGQRGVARPARVVATVMFTDVVGSTEHAHALGDRAWADLLATHHARIRAELRRFGGLEIDTAGDGFLAMFTSPTAAIGCAQAPIGMVGPTIIAHGSDAQKERFLPPTLRGDELWCQLFSEPDAGSDLASLTTRATLDGDQWVVDGQKVWTSSAQRSDFGILLARTDWDAPKHKGITYFLLDMTTPGITIRPLRQMTGESHFSEVFLDGVRIPAANVLGEPGQGWRIAQTTLMSERSSIAGGTGADPRGLIALARRFGRDRDPLVRQAIVGAHIQAELLRFLRYRMQTALSQGRAPGQEASVMKLAFGRYMKHMTETAVDLQGPAGLLAGPDLPGGNGVEGASSAMWHRRFLHSPSLRIAGGSDQVQANIIGERALGLPRDPSPDKDLPFRRAQTEHQ